MIDSASLRLRAWIWDMPLLMSTAEVIHCSIMFPLHLIYCSIAVRGNIAVIGVS